MKRRVVNPLALAVMVCLMERSMHPYEVATTLRERAKHESIKLNYGSLYTVVEALQRFGLIAPEETEREGRRPERTIYRLTDAGRIEVADWLSELLSTPVKEYTQFEAGLSLAGALPPHLVARLLTGRCQRLEGEIASIQAAHEVDRRQGILRLHMVESEYRLALLGAELAWTRQLVRDMESGTLEGLEVWSSNHPKEE